MLIISEPMNNDNDDTIHSSCSMSNDDPTTGGIEDTEE